MLLTPEQMEWLNQMGGRNEKHVLMDDDGRAYIELYSPHHQFNMEFVYLPYQ
jgi:hypothetical protein